MTKVQELRPARATFPWPTPSPQASDWMTELGEALKPHPDSGIASEEIMSLTSILSSFSDKYTKGNLNTSPPGAEIGRLLYS